jgi:hypothetical protein
MTEQQAGKRSEQDSNTIFLNFGFYESSHPQYLSYFT